MARMRVVKDGRDAADDLYTAPPSDSEPALAHYVSGGPRSNRGIGSCRTRDARTTGDARSGRPKAASNARARAKTMAPVFVCRTVRSSPFLTLLAPVTVLKK